MPSFPIAESAALAACAVAGVGGLLAEAAWRPDSEVFGRALIAGPDPAEVALTFDDGPHPTTTPMLLDLLASAEVRASFFVIGEYARQFPEILRQVRAAGHVVGNHTMTHPSLAVTAPANVAAQMRDCNALLEDILGEPVRFFRPPFGARRPAVFRAAGELGLTVVQWNATGQDWLPISAEQIAANVRADIARASVAGRASNVLLHDGSHLGLEVDRSRTLAAVDVLLQEFPARGKRFVTVEQWTPVPASLR